MEQTLKKKDTYGIIGIKLKLSLSSYSSLKVKFGGQGARET